MKKTFLFLSIFLLSFSSLFAAVENPDYSLASEVKTQTWTQIIIPEEIDWTQRFILTELKDLRIDFERHQRDIMQIVNNKELTTVDRALSYSWNTVNFLWLLMTMAVTGFGLVGWKTMKDVRENLTANFEKKMQLEVWAQQKQLEEFMQNFQNEQLSQSREILKNQEQIQHKQEAAFYWSQFNREEDPVVKLELLDKISILAIEEDSLLIFVEKSSIYIILWLWDKALESAEKGLEISSENTGLLYTKAEALVMLDNTEDALKVVNNILVIKPGMKEEILEDITFENMKSDIETMIEETTNEK